MKNGHIWDLIKDGALDAGHPTLSGILNNTNAVPQSKKTHVQFSHYGNKTT